MARESVAGRIARRAKIKEAMAKGPVRQLFEKGIRAYEDIRGLNIGGAESGRIARAQAVTKYLKSSIQNPSAEDRKQISLIGRGIRHPEGEDVLDIATVLGKTRERKARK